MTLTVLDASTAQVRPFDGADLKALSDADLKAVQEAMGAVRRAADALLVGVAGEVAARSEADAGRFARKEGFGNAFQMIAKTVGISPGEAGRLVDVGRAMAPDPEAPVSREPGAVAQPRFPHVATGIAAGTLSVQEANVITRTLETLPAGSAELEARLVDAAGRMSLRELKLAANRAWAKGSPEELEKREREARRERSLTFVEGDRGMTVMTAHLDPESAAFVISWCEAQVRAEFHSRRKLQDDGLPADLADKRTAAQIRVDALVALARHGMSCDQPGSGVKSTVVTRIDYDKLVAKVAVGTCDELQMPISASLLRRMAVDAQILPMVMGGGSLPMDYGRALRLHTPHQRLALIERDGGCAFCHVPPSYCDTHHIKWWARDGGRTDLRNGVMLCVGCHHRIHDDGWEVEIKNDLVWFFPPTAAGRERKPILGGLAALDLDRQPVYA